MNPQATNSRLNIAAEWFLRLALAAAFLSAVSDRLGIWGPPGSRGVAWGDWSHFQTYANMLNSWLPSIIQPFMAVAATVAEVAIGIGLLIPLQTRWVAIASGLLLTWFALSMTFLIGVKPPLDYSVWTAAAASFLLARTTRF